MSEERFASLTTTELLGFIRRQERDIADGTGVARARRDLQAAWNELDHRLSTGGELPEQWQVGREGDRGEA